MSKTPRQRCLAIMEEVGAEFDDLRPEGLYGGAYTPTGVMWTVTGCHTLAISFTSDRPAGWKSLLEDLVKGVEPCDNEGCEGCHDKCEDPSCRICR